MEMEFESVSMLLLEVFSDSSMLTLILAVLAFGPIFDL